ncbi:anti-sigma factor domain-containing protein [Streptomyces sp. NBC_01190]|uniref:anti-sigma factor n=1 Tax=Streptomyces sp. NBC_01190 TaxID=2903767 RepID=UPI00386BF034|nr:anti-sigma factor [Streptomyces sp. NBC_01190]
MTIADLHTLTGAYAVGALPEREAADFRGHLTRCAACAQEVREFRETAARLALAVAEVPPAALRVRVMAALPEVRQLPPVPAGARGRVVSLRDRRWRHRLPYLAAAACLVAAAVATGVAVEARRDADTQRDRGVVAEQRARVVSALAAAPDAAFHTGALTGGGSATVVSSTRLGAAAILYRDLPPLPGSRVYELWYSRDDVMVPAGLVDTKDPSGSLLLQGHPNGAVGVGVTVEPHGGSDTPSGSPLVVVPL